MEGAVRADGGRVQETVWTLPLSECYRRDISGLETAFLNLHKILR
jgi:hypothetical protein